MKAKAQAQAEAQAAADVEKERRLEDAKHDVGALDDDDPMPQ